MAKAPAKKSKPTAIMLVVMKKGNGKKMRGKNGCEDDMEEYRKGGMVKKKGRK